MSLIILERKDNLYLFNSYVHAYKTYKLYKMKIDYRKNILRIVKKAILGTNFIYYYSKQGLFIYPIFNQIIINLSFLLYPHLLYNSKSFMKYVKEDDVEDDSQNISLYNRPFNIYSFFHIFLRFFIINLLGILAFSVIKIKYKFKLKKINKYMEKYTQCAIEQENKIIQKYYNCSISKNGKFDIEIKSIRRRKKNINTNLNKHNKYFFKYIINFPNIRFLSHYTYKNIFLPKEKEIIDKIDVISNEIEYKYKKKLLQFLLIILSIITYIPLTNFLFDEQKKDYINYFGILMLVLYVERNNFSKSKNEQIEKISLLNNEYITNGYYIYINNDIISIFYIKEKYRNIKSIDKIKKMNQKLLDEFKIK